MDSASHSGQSTVGQINHIADLFQRGQAQDAYRQFERLPVDKQHGIYYRVYLAVRDVSPDHSMLGELTFNGREGYGMGNLQRAQILRDYPRQHGDIAAVMTNHFHQVTPASGGQISHIAHLFEHDQAEEAYRLFERLPMDKQQAIYFKVYLAMQDFSPDHPNLGGLIFQGREGYGIGNRQRARVLYDYVRQHGDIAVMANLTSVSPNSMVPSRLPHPVPSASLNHPDQWNPQTWEAYAASYCGNREPQSIHGSVRHAYSHSLCPPNAAAGRVSKISEGLVVTLAFRGSVWPENWMNDAWVAQRDLEPLNANVTRTSPFQAMRLHRGFLWEYRCLKELPDFQSMINDAQNLLTGNPRARLLLTGHSLGGALATICLLDLLLNRPRIGVRQVCLITLGSPRVGNRPLVEWLSAQHLVQDIRVEIETDIVTEVPDQNDGVYLHRGHRTLLRRVNDQYQRTSHSERRMEEQIAAPNNPLLSCAIWFGNFLLSSNPITQGIVSSDPRVVSTAYTSAYRAGERIGQIAGSAALTAGAQGDCCNIDVCSAARLGWSIGHSIAAGLVTHGDYWNGQGDYIVGEPIEFVR